MHKIDGAGHLDGQFVTEDAASGRPPTLVTADWLNAVQDELVAVLQAAGIEPDKDNNAQLSAAIGVFFRRPHRVGEVIAFAGTNPPEGYLECNGAQISRTDYAELFAVVGTIFGMGDGATTFQVPDLRGVFIRGWDNGKGFDSGRQLGSYQGDAVGRHNHLSYSFSIGGNGTGFGIGSGQPIKRAVSSGAFFGAPETRPKNVALMLCIRY